MKDGPASLLIGLLFILAGPACDRGSMCETTEVRRLASPSKALDLVVSVVNCGATTDYVTRVSIGSRDAPLAKTTDVVRVDSNHGEVGTGLQDEIPVDATWQSDHEVSLGFPEKTRIFGFYSDVVGVRISLR